MLQKLKKHINQNFPFLNESKLLIAISGGLDSVVLTHLFHKLKYDFELAHCNFNLRGKESDADEQFVVDLANKLNIEVFVESFDTEKFSSQRKISTQMAARELRYNWFNELSENLNFEYILTGHHADDNLETFLINLSRGTGLEGLTGIPEINENIVRPLLPFTREEIEYYAKAENLKWQEDSSNASTKYLRNKLRLEVIPKLKEINPQLLQNFNKTISHLRDSKTIIEDRVDDISDAVITKVSEYEIRFDISQIQALNNPKAYVYELLKDYGFTQWSDIQDLIKAQSGKQVFSATHRLIKDRGCLLLTEINKDAILNVSEQSRLITENTTEILSPIHLKLEEVKCIANTSNSIIYVDKSKLTFPLSLKKWQKGDCFFPFGMRGKKKLSKFFKDEKLSLIEKENLWLLCSGKDVVWVINRRADERFRVTKNTNQILKITLK